MGNLAEKALAKLQEGASSDSSGEVSPLDVLRVVRADGSWEGRRCPACSVGVVLDGDPDGFCANRRCESDRADSVTDKAAAVAAAADRDAMPDVEPF